MRQYLLRRMEEPRRSRQVAPIPVETPQKPHISRPIAKGVSDFLRLSQPTIVILYDLDLRGHRQ